MSKRSTAMSENTGSAGEASAEFFIVDSGLGDSLLLRVGDAWVAIDCCLPRSGRDSVWERYIALVKDLGIEYLDALILTHFHLDHYRGAAELIRWFHSENRGGIRQIYVTGSRTLRKVLDICGAALRRRKERSEFTQLSETIIGYCKPKGATGMSTQVADDPPWQLASTKDQWYFINIYPFGVDTDLMLDTAEDSMRAGKFPHIDHNALSGALFVCHRDLTFPLLLLGGDVPGDPAWKTALDFWRKRPDELPRYSWLPTQAGPAWIKIPHHGSYIQGHSDHILEDEPPPCERHAFVTAGADSKKHPDKRTLHCYHEKKIALWHAGRLSPRVADSRIHPENFAQWSFQAATEPLAGTEQLNLHESAIRVSWPENRPLPAEAQIPPEEIPLYP